jgi:hypothetical protein
MGINFALEDALSGIPLGTAGFLMSDDTVKIVFHKSS